MEVQQQHQKKILCHWNLIINNTNFLWDWIFFLFLASMGINRAELASSLASPVGQMHFIKSKRQIKKIFTKTKIYKINRTKNNKFHSRILIIFCYFILFYLLSFFILFSLFEWRHETTTAKRHFHPQASRPYYLSQRTRRGKSRNISTSKIEIKTGNWKWVKWIQTDQSNRNE